MKRIILVLIILVVVYFASYLYFGGFPVGIKNNYLVVYSYTCADVCPQQGSWYKKYYGKISYDQCVAIGGSPKLVGLIMPTVDGKPGPGSIGGYDGCRAK